MNRERRFDVVVVGARAAGASSALMLARRGLRVMGFDRAAYGTDTLSTHALMRTGVLALRRWGLLDRISARTPAIRTTRFLYGDEVLDLAIEPQWGVDALYAPRRTLLDAVLVDAARAAGAVIRHGVRLRSLIRDDDGRVRGVVVEDERGALTELEADLVVGADGVRSTVAERVGASPHRVGRHATAVAYGYFPIPERASRGYEWGFRRRVGTGVIPTGSGACCVFVAVPQARFDARLAGDFEAGFRALLAEGAPELAASLARLAPLERLRGFRGRVGHLRRCHGPGWALVGDAGYFKDPFTAHGISDALRDAELLARAVTGERPGGLAGYQERRDALSLRFFELTDAIASFDWELPALRQMHQELAKEMSREARALAELDVVVPRAA
ncbi:MAG: FAD-dependent monooxygenase [Planctomycetes bacterium]|nr:FAD-dependent monooxygenase [Planctomycetota bacterium]